MNLQVLFLEKVERKLNSMSLNMTFFLSIPFDFLKRRGHLNAFDILEVKHFVVRVAAEDMAVDLRVSLGYRLEPAPVVGRIKLFGHR